MKSLITLKNVSLKTFWEVIRSSRGTSVTLQQLTGSKGVNIWINCRPHPPLGLSPAFSSSVDRESSLENIFPYEEPVASASSDLWMQESLKQDYMCLIWCPWCILLANPVVNFWTKPLERVKDLSIGLAHNVSIFVCIVYCWRMRFITSLRQKATIGIVWYAVCPCNFSMDG